MQFLEKNLDFGNILGFLEETWAQKWTKIINFGYVLYPFKHLILKDCSETVFILISTNLSHICGRKGPETPQKGTISLMLHRHENIWKFITWQPQMLH